MPRLSVRLYQVLVLTTRYSFSSTEKNPYFKEMRVPSASLISKCNFSLGVCGSSSQSCSCPLQFPLLPYSSSWSETSSSEMNCLSILHQQKASTTLNYMTSANLDFSGLSKLEELNTSGSRGAPQPRGTGQPAGS